MHNLLSFFDAVQFHTSHFHVTNSCSYFTSHSFAEGFEQQSPNNWKGVVLLGVVL